MQQLEQLVAATKIELDEATIAYLEEVYRPVENLLSIGFS
jgi:aryl-alcohol dehydrogenase-like predicted oxidoreductase